MAASFKDPSASAVTRVEASVVFPSISAASSAYSNLDMSTELSPLPTTTPELAISCVLKSLPRPAMNEIGEKMSPCSTPPMLNGSDITFTPLGSLTRTIPIAAAKMAWMMRLTFALTPASASAPSIFLYRIPHYSR